MLKYIAHIIDLFLNESLPFRLLVTEINEKLRTEISQFSQLQEAKMTLIQKKDQRCVLCTLVHFWQFFYFLDVTI